MTSEVKSFDLLSLALVLTFVIDPILSVDYTTAPTALLIETTDTYDDQKCMSDLEYNLLTDAFTKQTVKDIRLNRSSEAMQALNEISPGDESLVSQIVRETLKQPDLKLLHLLEFVNETKLPTTKLSGLSDISVHLNNTADERDPFSWKFYKSWKTILKWLDLQYFTRCFVDGLANDSEILMEAAELLRYVEDTASRVIFTKSLTDLLNGDDHNGKAKFGSEHVFFIIKAFYTNATSLENIIEALELLRESSFKAKCWSIIALYSLIESDMGASSTSQLLPMLKVVSEYRPNCLGNLKLTDGSIFQKILSKNYFHLKNAHNHQYLSSKRNKRVRSKAKNSFTIKTVSEIDSDQINWKFGTTLKHRNDHIGLAIKNANFERNFLRVLPCLAHNDEFVVRMEDGEYYNEHHYMVNYAWSIEADDVTGDRFRIKNNLSKSYLAVSMDNEKSAVTLVNELNVENYDSVHWTLETIEEG